MSNLFRGMCIVQPVIFTKTATDEYVASLEAKGTNFKVKDGLVTLYDKNDKASVMLKTLAGQSVDRNLISGTVAEKEGFTIKGTFAALVEEKPANAYGRQFGFTRMGDEIPSWEIGKALKSMGEVSILKSTAKTATVDDATVKAIETARAEAKDDGFGD